MRFINFLNHKHCSQKTSGGFSLIETLVAISILMITIVGPLTLASKGVVFADYVKDEITGFYLAQEAIEAIKNIRDTNVQNNRSWLATIQDKCMSADLKTAVPCRIDIWNFIPESNYGLEKCSEVPEPCEQMKVVDIGNSYGVVKLYGYIFNDGINAGILGGNADYSRFSRKITITPVDYTNAVDSSGIKISAKQLSETKSDPSGVDEVNVTVEVSWLRANASSAANPDERKKYTERSVKVSENMFSI
ncbi:MAG: prepilin-type N-terminal cleavage/methylation domain-containing protein [Candidatus Vogelbacteria bacterium]|nr:prepilin-type N-terminal cleavage/methylation domain-containing protein [Candidatus Vogelbacteria bacterium]